MADHSQTLANVIDLVRRGVAVTRPDLMRHSDLGRTVVNQRVEEALAAGILVESDERVSTGGRPSTILSLSADNGLILAAVFGASRLHVAVADLRGRILDDRFFPWSVERGPRASLDRLYAAAAEMTGLLPRRRLWAAAIGLPGPVDFDSGRVTAPPIMPGWDDFPVRVAAEENLRVPVWIDNDVNVMALGTWHETREAAGNDVLLIKAGTGIGAGLISSGHLHRGARGAAGDIGHIPIVDRSAVSCRCGNFGCLEAYAGGWALTRDALEAGRSGESAFLAGIVRSRRTLSVEDVVAGVQQGDEVCQDLVRRSGALIGKQLASMVSFFNPSTVFIGGSLIRTGAIFLDEITDAVFRRIQPLSGLQLVVREVPLLHYEGVIGAANLVLDEIFRPANLTLWLAEGTPRSLFRARAAAPPTSSLSDRLDALSQVERTTGVALPTLSLVADDF